MTRAFGYIRYGGADSATPEGQRQNIASYCQTYGLELVHIFQDQEPDDSRGEESDRIMSRPALQDLLAALRDNGIEQVVAFNVSRLWRSEPTKVLIQRELRRYGADVRAVAQPNYSIYDQARDPAWSRVVTMVDLLVQYEQLEAALRLRRGRMRKASNGGYAGGRPPLGYRVGSTGELEIDPDKAVAVRRVFELSEQRQDGQSPSLQQIADCLNAEGCSTANGKPFQRVQVKRILDRRDFYLGHYRYGNVSVSGEHEPLLRLSPGLESTSD